MKGKALHELVLWLSYSKCSWRESALDAYILGWLGYSHSAALSRGIHWVFGLDASS